MAALKVLVLAAALVIAQPARTETVADWRPFIAEASLRFGVPVAWIERVIAAESAGRTRIGGRPIVSRTGAMGLMQLMPRTWSAMRDRLGLGGDPFDPHDNILAGTAYLRMMYDRFGYPGLFAAYNAGPARYGNYVLRGRALPDETRAYVVATAGGPAPPVEASVAALPPAMFVVLSAAPLAPAAPVANRLAADGDGANAMVARDEASLFAVRH